MQGLYRVVARGHLYILIYLEPRVSPDFAITYFCNHCNIRFENTDQSMWIHWPFFPKTWTKGHWPLDDLWPHVCWGHMCDSTQGSLCPSPMTIHQCMWIQWSILQNTTYIHIHTYIHTHTTCRMSDHIHVVSYWTQFRRDNYWTQFRRDNYWTQFRRDKKWGRCAYWRIKSRGYQWRFSCKKKKKNHLVTDSKKGWVIGCKIAQNLGIFNIVFSICKFFQNLMILLKNFDWKSKNIGGHFCEVKRGAIGNKPMQKRGSVDRCMT